MTAPSETRLADLKDRWESRPLLAALDTSVDELGEGYARLSMRRTDVTVGGIRNSINGGVVAALAELAAHVALDTVLEEGESIEGSVDVGISFVSATRGDPTFAEGRVVRKGGRLCVCEVEIRDGEAGTVNAKALVSCTISRPPRKE
jgi:uncharacterized protein (TIGR00369 family)